MRGERGGGGGIWYELSKQVKLEVRARGEGRGGRGDLVSAVNELSQQIKLEVCVGGEERGLTLPRNARRGGEEGLYATCWLAGDELSKQIDQIGGAREG